MHTFKVVPADIEQFVPDSAIVACGFENSKQARTVLRRRAEVSYSVALRQAVANTSSYCWSTTWNERKRRLVKSRYYSHCSLQW